MHYGFGGFGMIIFWIALIAVTIILVKLFAGLFSKNFQRSKASLDILKERYATGEITRDEYEEIKRTLVER